MLLRRLLLFLFFVSVIPISLSKQNNKYVPFPAEEFSIGFYDRNTLPDNIPHPPHPLFWTSHGKVARGLIFIYEYNVFHTKKHLSVNLGTSFASWVMSSQVQLVLSFFFELRVWFFRTSSFNPYFAWSMAAPTLLSRRLFGGYNLGERFIFQDYFGLGTIIGSKHQFDISFRLYHYSNGDLFLHNDGFDVPAVLTVGYVFKTI